MKAAVLAVSYELSAPANWKGTYTSNNASNDANWTWYKDGDPKKINFPHVTVVFTLAHEVSPTTGDWLGFHVSVPIDNGAKNARFNYKISAGKVVYSNMSSVGLTDTQFEVAKKFGNENHRVLDDFAQEFYKQANV